MFFKVVRLDIVVSYSNSFQYYVASLFTINLFLQLDVIDKSKMMTMKKNERRFAIDARYGAISRDESEGMLEANVSIYFYAIYAQSCVLLRVNRSYMAYITIRVKYS